MQFSNHSRRQDHLNWLAEIYRAYAADLQYFISNKVGDPSVAEDLTSTVFLKALRWLREDQSNDRVCSEASGTSGDHGKEQVQDARTRITI